MPISSSHFTIGGIAAQYLRCDTCGRELDLHTPYTMLVQLRMYAAERGWRTVDTTYSVTVACPSCNHRQDASNQQLGLPLEEPADATSIT